MQSVIVLIGTQHAEPIVQGNVQGDVPCPLADFCAEILGLKDVFHYVVQCDQIVILVVVKKIHALIADSFAVFRAKLFLWKKIVANGPLQGTALANQPFVNSGKSAAVTTADIRIAAKSFQIGDVGQQPQDLISFELIITEINIVLASFVPILSNVHDGFPVESTPDRPMATVAFE
ncbi:MAG TPA: hypothetical protein VMJ32_17165 [Pirellulales bacterium]|nr:hypothetical protein [Pirellulales bacterium]